MADECPSVEVRSQDLTLTFPGGATISAQVAKAGTAAPTPMELAKTLMAQATSAMAPLKPIFDIIGAVTAVKDLVTALVTDPFDIADAATALIEKIEALARLVPQLSVPFFILGLVDLLLTYIDGMADVLTALAEQESRIEAASEIAEDEDLAALRTAVECAREQLDAQLGNLKAGSGPIDDLIGLINTIGQLVPGMPEIPTMSDLGDNLEDAAEVVSTMNETLQRVRSAIPI